MTRRLLNLLTLLPCVAGACRTAWTASSGGGGRRW